MKISLLRVSPKRLFVACADLKHNSFRTVSLTRRMMNIVDSLNGCWENQTQVAYYYNKLKLLQDDMSRMHSEILEHTTDLEETERNYILDHTLGGYRDFQNLRLDPNNLII